MNCTNCANFLQRIQHGELTNSDDPDDNLRKRGNLEKVSLANNSFSKLIII